MLRLTIGKYWRALDIAIHAQFLRAPTGAQWDRCDIDGALPLSYLAKSGIDGRRDHDVLRQRRSGLDGHCKQRRQAD